MSSSEEQKILCSTHSTALTQMCTEPSCKLTLLCPSCQACPHSQSLTDFAIIKPLTNIPKQLEEYKKNHDETMSSVSQTVGKLVGRLSETIAVLKRIQQVQKERSKEENKIYKDLKKMNWEKMSEDSESDELLEMSREKLSKLVKKTKLEKQLQSQLEKASNLMTVNKSAVLQMDTEVNSLIQESLEVFKKFDQSKTQKVHFDVPKLKKLIHDLQPQIRFPEAQPMQWIPRYKHGDLQIKFLKLFRPQFTIPNPSFTAICSITNLKLSDSSANPSSFSFRVIKTGSYVFFGISLLAPIIEHNFLMWDWSDLGHGNYCFCSSGMVYSHHLQQQNCHKKVFHFGEGDLLKMLYEPEKGRLSLRKGEATYTLKVEKSLGREYVPCVYLVDEKDQVDIVYGE